MLKYKLLIEIGVPLIVVLISVLIYRFKPKRLKQSFFMERWKYLQKFCKKSETWPKAIEEADKLLKIALKKRKFKGRTMGSKMVSAQRSFSDNDSLWAAHNLFKKLNSDKDRKLKQSEVRDALAGYRQALRDLGALPDDKR